MMPSLKFSRIFVSRGCSQSHVMELELVLSPLRLELVRPRTYAKAIERHFGCSLWSEPVGTLLSSGRAMPLCLS